MKTCVQSLFSMLVAFCGLTVWAEEVSVIHADFWKSGGTSGTAWTDSEGNTKNWKDGSLLQVDSVYNGNWYGNLGIKPYGLVLAQPAGTGKGFWTDGSWFEIGAGGITFLNDDTVFSVGKMGLADVRLAISADQTWQGPENGSAHLAIGHLGYNDYYGSILGVRGSAEKLTVSRNLNLWMSSPSNDLSTVDVRIENGAKLHLAKHIITNDAKNEYDPDARLRAKTLTLAGTGTLLLGDTTTYPYGNRRYDSLTALDADHVTADLTLEDGATVTAQKDVTFAIPTVRAKGTGGAFVGNFIITQQVTSVVLSDGAVLDLTAAVLTEEGVSAALAISGSGSVRCAAATLLQSTGAPTLTGEISVGEGVAFVMTEAMNLSKLRFVGDGTLVVDPGAENLVVLGDLSGFTGTVRLASGKGLLLTGHGVATVVEDGGIEAVGRLIVSNVTRTEEELVVGDGEVLEVYGNGLTAATRLTMAGGQIRFLVDGATIAAPITATKPANIYAAYASVTGEISGFVTCAIPDDNSGSFPKTGIRTYGAGGIVFSGGMLCEVAEGLYEDGPGWGRGRPNRLGCFSRYAELRTGDYNLGVGDFCIGWVDGESYAALGKEKGDFCRLCKLGDGANVHFVEQKSPLGSSRTAISVAPPMDGDDYFGGKTALEVAAGATLRISQNQYVQVGGNQTYGRFVVSGGSVYFSRYTNFILGNAAWSTGELEMRAGLLELSCPLGHGTGRDELRVYWSGGTIRPTRYLEGELLKSNVRDPNMNNENVCADGSLCIKNYLFITGDNCVLDLANIQQEAFTNVAPGNASYRFKHSVWGGTGTLTVRGGAKCKRFVMNEFPGGAKLRMEGGVTVEVPETARIYDPAKTSMDWIRVYAPTRFTNLDTDEWTMEKLALAELQVVESGVKLEAPTKTNTIETLRIPTGGTWNNNWKLVNAASNTIVNAVFEPGSTWEITDRTQLVLPGTLTLPSDAEGLTANLQGVACPFVPATAAGGVTGSVDWLFARSPRRVTLLPKENPTAVQLDSLGLLLLFR